MNKKEPLLVFTIALFALFNFSLAQNIYPDPPTRLKARKQHDGSIVLSWKAAKASFVAGYNVYYHLVGKNGYFRANTKPIQDTKFKVPPLSPGKYSFFVRAMQVSHSPPTEGPNSNEVLVHIGPSHSSGPL